MSEQPANLPTPFTKIAIQLNPRDPLAIARVDIPTGRRILADDPALPFQEITASRDIPAGHKLALRHIPAGGEVLRYGSCIGFATRAISPGDWIHSHNLSVGDMQRDFAIRVVESQGSAAAAAGRTFLGYPRPNGQAGTRNLIAVVATVSCAAQTTQAIVQSISPELLTDYPHVDGVVAVTHSLGCCEPLGSLAQRYLQRSLLNLAHHPNIGGILYVSLGCEGNQMARPLTRLREQAETNDLPAIIGPLLTIQEQGGIAKTIAAGVEMIKDLLPQVNAAVRTPVPLAKLAVALQCGGSDGWSGVTANPLVGRVADLIVAEGGSVVLAETPEIYGAEHLLSSRVASQAVGEKLIERLNWWQEHAQANGFSLDNNPSPGNKAGGLTTIYEKSLGAVAKGGSTPLVEVVEYAERFNAHGLIFMDTPGYDPASLTGQLAGGCNIALFTTGRGTVFSGNLAPCIKVISNSATYQRMADDMDFNAGAILDGLPMEDAAQALLAQVIEIASGTPSQSERYGFRQTEFVPWHLGGML